MMSKYKIDDMDNIAIYSLKTIGDYTIEEIKEWCILRKILRKAKKHLRK